MPVTTIKTRELQERADQIAADAEDYHQQLAGGRGIFNALELRITGARLLAELASVVRELTKADR